MKIEVLTSDKNYKGYEDGIFIENFSSYISEGDESDKRFLEAEQLGIEHFRKSGYHGIACAPFCIDKIKRAGTRVIIEDSIKPLIELMKQKAVSESFQLGKYNTHYEASFSFVGRMKNNKIFIEEAFWDEEGFGKTTTKTSKGSYYDPDCEYGSFDSFFRDSFRSAFSTSSGNITTPSDQYIDMQDSICADAQDNENGIFVFINGHTHPFNKDMGKLNNYPSRDDVSKSISEAREYFSQPNGKCIYLNAIINAEGDLNIFGVNLLTGEYLAYDNIVYKASGDHVASLTEGKYPIEKEKI